MATDITWGETTSDTDISYIYESEDEYLWVAWKLVWQLDLIWIYSNIIADIVWNTDSIDSDITWNDLEV